MTRRFSRLRYHVTDDPVAQGHIGRPDDAFRSTAPSAPESGGGAPAFTSVESAARFYLSERLADEDGPAFQATFAPQRPELVPDLDMRTARDIPATGTTLVRFAQTHRRIPVFGGEALVELDADKSLVAIDARLGDVAGAPGRPAVTVPEALAAVGEATGTSLDVDAVAPPDLTYYQDDETGTWHLAWHLREIPAAPPETRTGTGPAGHRLDRSPRDLRPLVDYLVDAHDGTILYYYASAPTVAIPTKLKGFDENDTLQDGIWGDKLPDAYAIQDRLRNVRTFDLGLGDIDSAVVPSATIAAPTPDLGRTFTAAVSAHANATRVHDFYSGVLHRNGIDDLGMDLDSVINCFYSGHGPGPEWRNAVWFNKRMWYGQIRNEAGKLVSMARYLDVIAHELTHGVIETSSKLVYRGESGALNESFADIFGIVIKNWYEASTPADVTTWNWELGPGLGGRGLPLRDLSDPARTGDPAHMRDFVSTRQDFGGVHTNSGINNKAAHLLLTARTADGRPVLDARDWAVLLYLTLVRLPALATFADVPLALRDVAKVYLSGSAEPQERALAAIDDAYRRVGVG
jgi:Zn-dependent metalloprotease